MTVINAADIDDIQAEENPFHSLVNTVVFSSADWGAARDLAWVYGIVVGWEDEDDPTALDELAPGLGWSAEKVERLRRLRTAFVAAASLPGKIDRVLAELAAHAKDCTATPDPDADGPEAWVDARHQLAAANAYRHAARILREAAGVAA